MKAQTPDRSSRKLTASPGSGTRCLLIARMLTGFVLVLLLWGTTAFANPARGTYRMLVDGDGKLQATVENGELKVRVIAIKPEERNMRDEKNPKKSLRNRRVLGMVVMEGFRWNEKEQHWQGGTIYDPTDGASYDAFIWSDPGTGNLKVRAYRLIGWLGRTETFERISGTHPERPQAGEPELVYFKE